MIQARVKTQRKARPPAFLAAFIGVLTPRKFRSDAVGLVSNYTNLSAYCISAIRQMFRAMRLNVRPALNPKRLIGDLACVFIAFNTLPLPSVAGILVIATLMLLCR